MSSAPADIAVPPVAYLREMGVTVCAGSDGIRDAWSPMGNGDPLERAWLMAYRFDWNKDEQLHDALDAVTGSAAKAIGRPEPTLVVAHPPTSCSSRRTMPMTLCCAGRKSGSSSRREGSSPGMAFISAHSSATKFLRPAEQAFIAFSPWAKAKEREVFFQVGQRWRA